MNVLSFYVENESQALKVKESVLNNKENKFVLGFDFRNLKIYFLLKHLENTECIDVKSKSLFLALSKTKHKDIIRAEVNKPIKETLKEVKLNNELKDPTIDFIFPYVSAEDLEWQKLYFENVSEENLKSWGSGATRFRDNGTLKYLLRSLDRNMPWLNKVHMIVMSESQVPDWINRNEVDIIYHSEFMPKEILPTFNSTTIETFLPLLPRVGENFIYGNDDLFVFKPQSKSDFFKEGKPSYYIYFKAFSPSTAPGDYIRLNVFNTNRNLNQNEVCVTTQHGLIPFKKSLLKEYFDENKKVLLESVSKFREQKNFNQYIYADYQFLTENTVNEKKSVFVSNIDKERIKRRCVWEDYDFVCFNDADDQSNLDFIISNLNKKFPKKSKYELH